jgi:hypothetical protein
VVDENYCWSDSHLVNCLGIESMTPLTPIFPLLQKLILVGELGEAPVVLAMVTLALDLATCKG